MVWLRSSCDTAHLLVIEYNVGKANKHIVAIGYTKNPNLNLYPKSGIYFLNQVPKIIIMVQSDLLVPKIS